MQQPKEKSSDNQAENCKLLFTGNIPRGVFL